MPELIARQKAPLATPSDLAPDAVADISAALNALLADVFTLCLKTKNFHWHLQAFGHMGLESPLG